ncbi:MAG TPA: ABC transporter ATP-binding protein [Gemmatimonadales bacterium]|jgi:subfamily B ATP-binding cassette protein MsbA|nr:ABC transporter ATP-binding protein [Gemmatimonadales bacterium]
MAAGTTRRLLETARPYRGRFLLGLLATLLASVLDGVTIVVLIPLLKALFGTAGVLATQVSPLERVSDRLLAPLVSGIPPPAAAFRLVLVLLAGLLLKNALQYTSNQLSVAVQEGIVRDLRVRLFRHLLGLELGFFQRTRAGQLIATVLVDADRVKQAVSAALTTLFQNGMLILSTLVILATISWRLTLITLATAPLLVLGIRVLLRRLRRHARLWTEEQGELTATVTERLAAVKLVRAYGGEAQEAEAFAAQTQRYRKRVQRTQRYASMTSPVSEVFGGLVLILIVWAAAAPTLAGARLGPEVTIVFLVAALKIMSPIKQLSQFPAAWTLALAGAERVFDVLDRPAAETDPADALPAVFAKDIVFDRVNFEYEPGRAVLREVSFTVPRGTVLAIVGPSGAGKTTLLELLPRFYEPASGELRLDGVPLPRISRRSLRALIGLVSQDPVILNDSVHANIAYAVPSATREEVAAAARAANAHEFISALPDGYDTLLGERGTRLSGGQRQRLAIARALLRDPPILLLDEATSALDTESERQVQDAIARLMRQRTVLVVAHRLATVLDADEILVLDGGRLVERGSHAALLAENGLYRRLFELQFRGAELLV